MSRRFAILPLLLAAALVAAPAAPLTGQQPAAQPAKGGDKVDIRRSQEDNLKLYKKFAEETLRLAQRWEKSDDLNERERAKALRAALKLIEERGVENLFKDLVDGLGRSNPTNTDFTNLIGKDEKLILALKEILSTLETEDEAEKLRREIAELTALKKEIERLKREQENIRARTENPRGDAERIAKDQKELARQTQEAANKFPGSKDSKGGNSANAGQDTKSEPKPETKPGESSPEAKPDTQENKTDAKPGDAAGTGDPKDPKGGPQAGEPRPSPKGGPPPGESRDPPKDGMGPAGEPKPGPTEPKDPTGGMAGEPKPMSGDGKAQGDNKGEGKPSAGQQGGEAKPMPGGMGGQQQSGNSKPSGGGQPMPGGQPSPGGPQGPKDDAQENVQQAVPDQQNAERDLQKNEREKAAKNEDKAIEKLQKAIEELEKRLKQLREKELARLLANLEERVNRMLRMQIEVYQATQGIHAEVVKLGEKSKAHTQRAQVEGDKEGLIVAEAEKALKLMEGEGSAVVFAGVLAEVKNDMTAVQKRLLDARVEGRSKSNEAEGTQLIEEQIIEQLTLMKEALKKARKDLENQQNQPPPNDPNADRKPNNKLIDLINELKLIKSLQEQVNKRTISYNKQDPGEQAKDALIQSELKLLSDRQKTLQEMLHKIATQANQ